MDNAFLNYAAPFFIVADVKTSVAFYVDKLGFEVEYLGPDPEPFFAVIKRDNVMLMLKTVGDGIKPLPNPVRHKYARWDAFIGTADPDGLFEEFESKNVAFAEDLENGDDNLRGFAVADEDGYTLFFGRPLTTEERND